MIFKKFVLRARFEGVLTRLFRKEKLHLKTDGWKKAFDIIVTENLHARCGFDTATSFLYTLSIRTYNGHILWKGLFSEKNEQIKIRLILEFVQTNLRIAQDFRDPYGNTFAHVLCTEMNNTKDQDALVILLKNIRREGIFLGAFNGSFHRPVDLILPLMSRFPELYDIL